MFDSKTKILIIDDMFAMRKLVVKSFKELGFTDMTEAGDGAAGWQALTEANPPFQLIVSDWNMPKLTGIDLLKQVRADNRFKEMPFLMVTAEGDRAQVVEAITAGVSNYVIKPFDTAALKEKLEAIYEKIKSAA